MQPKKLKKLLQNINFYNLKKVQPISKVLHLKNLEYIYIQNLYNLFSNFGNILCIQYFTEENEALIEFENEMYAAIAQHFLNDMKFYSKRFQITFRL